MTKKEFLKRFDKMVNGLDAYNYIGHTCVAIGNDLSLKARCTYELFINDFLYFNPFKDNYFLRKDLFDEINTKECFREFLVHQFKDEVLRSGIYKEF